MLKQQSKPLSEIVRDMNKFSNNFIAEQLVKHLGAVKKGLPGSTAKGIDVMENFLQSWGVPRGTYMLENGSGLSSSSRISAAHLARVLAVAYKNRSTHPDFIESLSILGTDGTMKNWHFAPELVGWLRAKTGSLANVSALAGYVPMRNGEIAAFAILANGFRKGKYSAHEAELMITQAIAEAGR
jgi:D-alanyl-D-alanine carboxypeptidase/D-alanyl-D-alanine-endopeptidase (penicillin-binding protein 4)